MSLVCAAVTPHGSSIIEEIAGEQRELFKPTRVGMEKMAETLAKYQPDTVVLLTPHGLRLKDFNSVYTTEHCRGELSQFGETVSLDYNCDKPLALELLAGIEDAEIPVVGANYGSLSGLGSNIVMDWGTLIPLWFLSKHMPNQPKLVVVTPTRDIPITEMVRLGEVIGRVCQQSSKRIALIASADQGHAHSADFLYGYHPAAKIYDDKINEIVKSDRLEELLHFDEEIVTHAKPDSLWQMLILYGALQICPMKGEFISYQVPTYFGMMVATYEPGQK